MTHTIWLQDAIVYVFLIAVTQLYAWVILRQLELKSNSSSTGKRVVSRFRKYSILLVTYITGVGIAHQGNLVQGIGAYALIGVGIVGFLYGLYVLRRILRST